MMKGNFPITAFQSQQTPFYYYDLDLLQRTLEEIKAQAPEPHFHVHYAMKACVNPAVLKTICEAGLGADCVSGGEIEAALAAGIPPERIVYAGVGKADWEIKLGLHNDIYCFNAESEAELEVINALAAEMGKTARIALRVNPNVDAHTHHYITTGVNGNKFGIELEDLDEFVNTALVSENIDLCGVHFHIGSQILYKEPFKALCGKVEDVLARLERLGALITIVDVGGGLGIDYDAPDEHPIPDFENYFQIFENGLRLKSGQELHFEPGRALVGQCGSLITKVLYVKESIGRKFVIVDGGMNDLIRPALYQAHHKIENISSVSHVDDIYDVVGPICESSDCFGTDERLPIVSRGDYLALRSAGAYGEVMASSYNCRPLPRSIFSDDLYL